MSRQLRDTLLGGGEVGNEPKDKEAEECIVCMGSGEIEVCYGHDEEGNNVWVNEICWKCNGTGVI